MLDWQVVTCNCYAAQVRAQEQEMQLEQTTKDLTMLKLQQQELEHRLQPAAVQTLISPEVHMIPSHLLISWPLFSSPLRA